MPYQLAKAVMARFGWLDNSTHGYAFSLVHNELSWWGLKSSLHLHIAHMHCGSHYSVRSPSSYHALLICHIGLRD
jgi:hypothetical protein